MNKSVEDLNESSEDTVIVEEDDLDRLIKKYTSKETLEPKPAPKISHKKDLYSLDEFTDAEHNNPALPLGKTETASHNSWHHKFSAEDFCEDSNDLDYLLNRIKQVESAPSSHNISHEVQALLASESAIPEMPRSSKRETVPETSYAAELQHQLEEIKSKIKLDLKQNRTESGGYSFEDSEDIEDLVSKQEPKTAKKRKTSEKSNKDIDKELAKAAKAKERELKKLEKENQKQLKNALKVVENSSKPDQCIQFLIVNIDEKLHSKPCGEVIVATLMSKGFNHSVLKQTVPNLITFTRKVPTIQNMSLQTINQEEKHCLLIIDLPEFIQLVNDETLVGHVQSMLSMPQVGHLSLGIVGLQSYYKYLKDGRNGEFKAAPLKNLPKVTREKIEKQLVQLQVFCKNIYVRPLEIHFEDLAVFVAECAKSVAQLPFKAAKAQTLQLENEFFAGDNKDCVKIDKDGNGLNRLWNQMLRMFPLASLETAEAITSLYPTMHSLMEAYKNCNTTEDGEKLLQDIPVRRAAGPLSGQRKLGPELSKKIYKFFTSEENILL